MDEIASNLLWLIVGAFIGFLGSYLLWYLQERDHRKTVMSAFEIELKRLEPLLLQASVIIQKIQNPKPSTIDQYGQDNSWELFFPLYQELKLLKLYSNSGNWYVLKKDLYSLDPKISSELDIFYYNLTEAEFNRIQYLGENYRDKRDIFLEPLVKNLRDAMNSQLRINDML